MKKNKKLIIIITTIILVIIIGIIIYASIFQQKNTNKQSTKEEQIEYIYKDNKDGLEGPSFYCSSQKTFSKTDNYNKGNSVYCRLSYELISDQSDIKEIWFETSYDEDIEFVETLSSDDELKVEYSNDKETNNKITHLTMNRPSAISPDTYILRFKIKESTTKEKLQIFFQNIKFKNIKNEYYKTNDITIDLPIILNSKENDNNYQENKYKVIGTHHNLNNSITFYKLNENNEYEKINEYQCKTNDCYISICSRRGGIGDIHYNNIGIGYIHDNNIILYDFNKGIIGEYICKGKSCTNGIDARGGFYDGCDTGIDFVINDDYSVKMYDFKRNKNIMEFKDMYPIQENEIIYFYVQGLNDKWGIVDANGNMIKDFKLEDLEIFIGRKYGYAYVIVLEPFYSIKYNLLVDKKDNKYGIIRMTSDDILIEHQYDDISLYNDKYFKAKIDDKWYLYSYETKEKVHEDGYKELFITTDDIIITQIDNYLYLKDYNGNNLTEEKIQIYEEFPKYIMRGSGPRNQIIYNEESNKIKISIPEYIYQQHENVYHEYEYDINNKKLTYTQLN